MNIIRKIIIGLLLAIAAYNSQAQTNNNQAQINNNINITKLTANEKDNKLSIKWSTDGKVATNYFEVQQSEDGTEFRTIALVLGPDPCSNEDDYKYSQKVKKGSKAAYFRIKHVDTNWNEQLSKIIQL